MKTITGIPGSPGIAIGKVFLYTNQNLTVPVYPIERKEVNGEMERLFEAVEKTRSDLQDLKERSKQHNGEKDLEIIETHLMILDDPDLTDQVRKEVSQQLVNAERALEVVIRRTVGALEESADEYLKERTMDFYDVFNRVMHHLLYLDRTALYEIQHQVILVSGSLLPSEVLTLNKTYVKGFALDAGGKTSHTAILARSFEIPAVLGLKDVTSQVSSGDVIITDGNEGKVIIRPDRDTIEEYVTRLTKWESHEKKLLELHELSAVTTDGHRVNLRANLEIPEEVESALIHGAEGVGLYRSEFLFLKPGEIADEQEQYEAYANVIKGMGPDRPVTIRTIDVGGDKVIPELEVSDEENPILGWRAVRFCLSRRDIFRTQLKAMLRASVHGQLRIMFPMISGIEELHDVLDVLNEVKQECRDEEIPFDESIQIGTMIEVPAAALISDIIARHVDFFSIGTNDLIQYTIAVDRGNEKIAYLYQPFHPGVLRFIKMIIESGHKEGIPVGMCGEMAGDPLSTVLLLGLGLDEFSMSPAALLEVKRIIRSVNLHEAQELVDDIMEMQSYRDINTYVRKWMNERIKFFKY